MMELPPSFKQEITVNKEQTQDVQWKMEDVKNNVSKICSHIQNDNIVWKWRYNTLVSKLLFVFI